MQEGNHAYFTGGRRPQSLSCGRVEGEKEKGMKKKENTENVFPVLGDVGYVLRSAPGSFFSTAKQVSIESVMVVGIETKLLSNFYLKVLVKSYLHFRICEPRNCPNQNHE